MQVTRTLVLGALLAGMASAGAGGDDVKPVWKAELGKPAVVFDLTDTDGVTWSLEKLHGKTVVLEWFNPDCPVVKGAHGEGGPLATFASETDGREDTVWIAINSGAPGKQGTGRERNAKAREAWSLSYPVLLDESGWVGQAYGARTTPHMYVIDAKGLLVYVGHHDNVAAALDDVWAGRKVAAPKTKSQGCGVKYSDKADVGLSAPDFELTCCVTGETVRLSDQRGKVVVLEWFNPECPIVKAAHGDGGSLANAAGRWTEKDVVWVAINSGSPGKQGTGADKNKGAAKGWSMAHPVLLDESGKVGQAYGARTTPHMYVIDQRGVLRYAGAHDDKGGTSYVDQAIAAVMAGETVATPKTKPYGCGVKY